MERDLLALPVRLGGLGVCDPSKKSAVHYTTCETIATPLVQLIIEQSLVYTPEVKAAQTRMRSNARKVHRQHEARMASDLTESLPTKFQRKEPPVGFQPCPSQIMGLSCTKGPSETPCACGMLGDHRTYHPTVSVANTSPSCMLSAA